MLRMDKLTIKAQEALAESQEVAARHDHQQIEPMHLLAALLAQSDGVVRPLLTRLGVPPDKLAVEMETGLSDFRKLPAWASSIFRRR